MFNKKRKEDFWPSVTDMMSGLMLIFLFISIIYLKDNTDKINKLVIITEDFEDTEKSLYEKLDKEFKNDIDDWNAEIDPQSLSVIFKEPDVLFDKNSFQLKNRFKIILNDFFPRFIKILKDDFKNDIKSVRIEGHTSSETLSKTGTDFAYIGNMELSQNRASSVLNYVLEETINWKEDDWTRSKLQAVGFSSSKIKNKTIDNKIMIDEISSRRVEFKVVTKTQEKLYDIVKIVTGRK